MQLVKVSMRRRRRERFAAKALLHRQFVPKEDNEAKTEYKLLWMFYPKPKSFDGYEHSKHATPYMTPSLVLAPMN